jgi:UPF0716 protein FxsA
MPWLALLFIGVPMLELAVLIEVGSRIGTLTTVALLIADGVIGAALARAQGVGTLRRLQTELAQGRMPTDALVDGAIILVSAALLLTPGLVSDVIGLLGLLPPVRALIKRALWRRIERAVRASVVVRPASSAARPNGPQTFDAEFERHQP